MYAIKVWLYGLFSATKWVRNCPYDPALDAWFLKLLESGEEFTRISRYTASFGGKEIWIANWPYAAFTIHGHDALPARYTQHLLNRQLTKSVLKHGRNC